MRRDWREKSTSLEVMTRQTGPNLTYEKRHADALFGQGAEWYAAPIDVHLSANHSYLYLRVDTRGMSMGPSQ